MLVKELIDLLAKCDPEKEVVIPPLYKRVTSIHEGINRVELMVP